MFNWVPETSLCCKGTNSFVSLCMSIICYFLFKKVDAFYAHSLYLFFTTDIIHFIWQIFGPENNDPLQGFT